MESWRAALSGTRLDSFWSIWSKKAPISFPKSTASAADPMNPATVDSLSAPLKSAETLYAIPVLGEWPSWPSGAVICVIALGVVVAAGSANQGNFKGESR
jgi:hypothetical protein